MTRGGMSPVVYKRLVAAYMAHPGQHYAAVKATGLNYRTCRKAWEEGLPYDYARQPIRDVVVPANADLIALDRLEREAVAEEGGELSPAPPLTGPNETLDEEVVRNGVANLVRKRMAAMKLLTRTQENASMGQALLHILMPSLKELAEFVAERMSKAVKVAKEAGPDADPGLGASVIEGFQLLRVAGEMGRTQAAATKLTVESEGLVLRDLRTSLTTGDAFTNKKAADDIEEVDDETLLKQLEAEEADLPKRKARIAARLGVGLRTGSGSKPAVQHVVEMPATPAAPTTEPSQEGADAGDGTAADDEDDEADLG